MNTNRVSSSPPLQYSGGQSTTIGTDVQCYYITDIVIECALENTDHPGPTTMDVQIFSPEKMTGEALTLEKISSLEWRDNDGIKLMDDVTFYATWDETGRGSVHLTKVELAEFITGTNSHNQATREFMIETDEAGLIKLRLRFEVFGIPSDENLMRVQQIERNLQYGIEMAKDPEKIFAMVLELSDDTPEKLCFLEAYIPFFMRRWAYNTDSLTDLDNCILAFGLAVHLAPEDHADMPGQLSDLGNLLRCRFEHTGDLTDIFEAISSQQKAVHLTPQGHAEMPGRLSNLGSSFLRRFECTGDLTDISEAISFHQKAVHLILQGHADMPAHLSNLGISFSKRFERTGDLADISEAISSRQKAVHLTPQGHADMPAHLNSLGISYSSRFEHTGDFTDISEAISSQQKAVHLTPYEHEDMPIHLGSLGNSLRIRFERTGDLADIFEAISSQQKAVHLTPQGHADMPAQLSNLGNSLHTCFERTGDLTDISEAISSHQKAVHLTPQGHASMPTHLNNLGNSLRTRFGRTGDLTDISEAISSHQKAVHLIPQGDANMPAHMSNLGTSFSSCFDRTGDLTDISEAISSHQRAVYLAPQGHANMPGWLTNLGNSLHTRFERTGDLIDIFEAISSQQKAVYLTPQGHADMPARLNNLGNSFQSRFKHTRDLIDISEAMSSQQKAVHLTPQGHARMPARLSNLGNSLRIRFKHTGDLTDISEAISSQQKSVQLTSQGHAEMPARLNNLGTSFQSRFVHTGDLSDISEAISSLQKAIHLTPQGHADLPSWLRNLGDSFQSRFKRTGELSDIHLAISNFSLAATHSSGPPSIRLDAAIVWARLCQQFAPSQSLHAYDTAIQLISQVAGLEHTIQKRHTNLLDVANVVASASACAFKLEKPDLALEWLEQGRCLVWTQLNNLRTPLDALFDHNPTLADGMLRVSRALENAGSRGGLAIYSGEATMEQKMSLQDEATIHVTLAQEWDQLLANVRAMPGFQDFLRPPSSSNLLKHLPDSGAVVVINVHEDSCDALALVSGSDELLHIPLPKFSYSKANDLRTQLNAYLYSVNLRMRGCELDGTVIRGGRPRENGDVIKGILHQLWSLVVKPVFDGLGFSVEPVSSLPRIWWCASGPLAFLPIHAAGIYATSTTKAGSTVSDFAVSSYIPTVRTLSERVKAPRAEDEEKTGLFMISQPETPNQARIPGTTTEVRQIKQLLENHNLRVLCLEGKAATVEQMIKNMETHSCIHFACHASQNTIEPLKSGFMLQDGALELSAIIKKNLVGADLAYLSACQTSTGDERLSEEAVHLAAGMLAAGYRGVVATMWSISDKHGPQVAKDFYDSLITHGAKSKGSSALSSGDAARALHYATQKLRQEEASSSFDWVPYVHFGL